jgi:hypothetical protein
VLFCQGQRLDRKAGMLIILADFMEKSNGIGAKAPVLEFVRGE